MKRARSQGADELRALQLVRRVCGGRAGGDDPQPWHRAGPPCGRRLHDLGLGRLLRYWQPHPEQGSAQRAVGDVHRAGHLGMEATYIGDVARFVERELESVAAAQRDRTRKKATG